MFGYPQIILCQELFTFYLWNIGGLITAKIRLKLKKVGKTAGPFKYHRNEIPYNYMLGSALGIIDKMEARPQTPLLILQAWSWDEGARPCNSDLSFPLLG